MDPEVRFQRIEALLHAMAERENQMEIRFNRRMDRADARMDRADERAKAAEDRYKEALRVLNEVDGDLLQAREIYENLVNDLYSIGTYLSRHKYRYLRFSYVFFLAGFLIAAAQQMWSFAT